MSTTASKQENALHAIETALVVLQAVPILEGTDKDSVEKLLEIAVRNLKAARGQ